MESAKGLLSANTRAVEGKAPYKLYWGDSHLNLHSCDREHFEEAFRDAQDHLDFLPIAYYPMNYYHDRGFRVETWHNRSEFLAEWQLLNDLCRTYNQPGRFVTFPGYEWHGNRTRWGDHNVYYFGEGQPLDDCDDIDDLYRGLRKRRGLAIPHHVAYMVGQRGKDWGQFDPDLSPFVEIYSKHGCSEAVVTRFPERNPRMGPWTSGGSLADALACGLRVGIVCSGDNHQRFAGVYGNGLMGAWATGLTRESLWEAFLARRVYGVTGDRIVVEYQVNDAWMGSEIRATGPVHADVRVECPQALDRIEWLRNNRVLKTYCHQDGLERSTENPLRCRLVIQLGWGPSSMYGFDDQVKEWNGRVFLSDGELVPVQGCWTVGGNSVIRTGQRELEFRTLSSGPEIYPGQAFIVEARGRRNTRMTVDAEPFHVSFDLEEALSGAQLWADVEGSKQMVHERFGLHPDKVENVDGFYHNAYKLRILAAVTESEYKASVQFCDPSPPRGRNSYYVRVSEVNGQAAWTSPIWVEQR